MYDIDARQSLLESLVEQGKTAAAQTISAEHAELEQRSQTLLADYARIKGLAADKKNQLMKVVLVVFVFL